MTIKAMTAEELCDLATVPSSPDALQEGIEAMQRDGWFFQMEVSVKTNHSEYVFSKEN